MGDILVRLRGNVATGQREIVVEYESDPDMTHAEHEHRHREIAELLVREGRITRDEVDQIVFEERRREHAADEKAAEGQG